MKNVFMIILTIALAACGGKGGGAESSVASPPPGSNLPANYIEVSQTQCTELVTGLWWAKVFPGDSRTVEYFDNLADCNGFIHKDYKTTDSIPCQGPGVYFFCLAPEITWLSDPNNSWVYIQ